jgi:tight adherence protein C
MIRPVVFLALVAWIGVTLLLSELRWFRRPRLGERLRPYTKGSPAEGDRRGRSLSGEAAGRGVLSASSIRDVVAPLSQIVGERLARAFGIRERLETRLVRIHSPLDPAAFRVRQVGWSGAGLAAGLLVAAAARLPAALAALVIGGTPLLAFLLVEQGLSNASKAWQERVTLELPVISEQLAMLLAAGYSLGAALTRVAERSQGACARDLAVVCNRVRQGLTEIDALREWATVVRVDAVDRLVPVLALNSETSDLGRLVSEEARTIRRDIQRQAVATMDRRGQQVWVPVTVATLVPGVILLTVPFIQALRLFSGS